LTAAAAGGIVLSEVALMRLLVPVLLLSACSSELPDVLFTVWPPEIILDPIGWRDEEFEWETAGILNDTYFTLTVTNLTLTGDGASNLELLAPADGLTVDIRDSARFQVRVRPPLNDDRTLWNTDTFEAAVEFDISGYPVTDVTTGEPDTSQRASASVVLPVSYALNCDLDGDGYDSNRCSGVDCDDDLHGVNPGAAETCDGIDNNCALGTDEGCP
jgi:hypothetical protein